MPNLSKPSLGLTAVLFIAAPSQAANVEAGRAKVAQVCAACHGAEGVSVSDTIPNLAGQRARYLEDQLRALKSGRGRDVRLHAQHRQDARGLPARLQGDFHALPRDLAKGPDGIFIPNQLVYHSLMERGEQWGRDFPAMLRNEDWNYAAFLPNGQPRPGINHAECLACHKPQDEVNFMFTMKELRDLAVKAP